MQYRVRRIGDRFYIEKLDRTGLVNEEFTDRGEAQARIAELEAANIVVPGFPSAPEQGA